MEKVSHDSSLGRWRSAWRPAATGLCGAVLGYFGGASFLPSPLWERHLAAREVALMLNFGAAHRRVIPEGSKQESAWVTGLQSGWRMWEAAGEREFMIIRLTPLGAHRLLGVPMELLTDQTVGLAELQPRWAGELWGAAARARGWSARFDAVEGLVAARLEATPAPAGMEACWRRLQSCPQPAALALLPGQFGCSRRHFIARCRRYFGMAPKNITRLARFHQAVGAMRHPRGAGSSLEGEPWLEAAADGGRAGRLRWAELAAECGYCDQAHLIREFHEFAGRSPAAMLGTHGAG